MARVPAGQRLRSLVLQGTCECPDATVIQETLFTHAFDDDVKVIGVELGYRWQAADAESNQDTQLETQLEVSRSPWLGQPGILGRLFGNALWNGLFAAGADDICDNIYIPFSNDAGQEIDEGEYINLLFEGRYTGNIASVYFVGYAIVYYVER